MPWWNDPGSCRNEMDGIWDVCVTEKLHVLCSDLWTYSFCLLCESPISDDSRCLWCLCGCCIHFHSSSFYSQITARSLDCNSCSCVFFWCDLGMAFISFPCAELSTQPGHQNGHQASDYLNMLNDQVMPPIDGTDIFQDDNVRIPWASPCERVGSVGRSLQCLQCPDLNPVKRVCMCWRRLRAVVRIPRHQ